VSSDPRIGIQIGDYQIEPPTGLSVALDDFRWKTSRVLDVPSG
jgi:hypothetical protein